MIEKRIIGVLQEYLSEFDVPVSVVRDRIDESLLSYTAATQVVTQPMGGVPSQNGEMARSVWAVMIFGNDIELLSAITTRLRRSPNNDTLRKYKILSWASDSTAVSLFSSEGDLAGEVQAIEISVTTR